MKINQSALRIVLFSSLAILPIILPFCMETRLAEERIQDETGQKLQVVNSFAAQKIENTYKMVARYLAITNRDEGQTARLQELIRLFNNKKPSNKQIERQKELTLALKSQFAELAGEEIKLSLINSLGTVVTAEEESPFPLDTSIAHTAFFKDVRAGNMRAGIELSYLNMPVMVTAFPLITKDGMLIIVASTPLSTPLNKALAETPGNEKMAWAVTIKQNVALEAKNAGFSGHIKSIPDGKPHHFAPKTPTTALPLIGQVSAKPLALKTPENCGIIAIGQKIPATIDDLAVFITMDNSERYSFILIGQLWLLLGTLISLLIFIVFSLFRWRLTRNTLESISDQVSNLIVKGAKGRNTLSPNAYPADFNRLVVLINKLASQISTGNSPISMGVQGGQGQALDNGLNGPGLADLGSPIGGDNALGSAFIGASLEEDNGEEKTIDTGLINSITDNMPEEPENPLKMADDISAVSDMLSAVDELDAPGNIFNQFSMPPVAAPAPAPMQPMPTPAPIMPIAPVAPAPAPIMPIAPAPMQPMPTPAPIMPIAPVAPAPAPIMPIAPAPMQPMPTPAPIMPIAPVAPAPAPAPIMPPPSAQSFPEETLDMGLLEAEAAGGEEAAFLAVFEEYKRVRQECGESIADLKQDKFIQKLHNTKASVIASQGCTDVRFQVYVKNGKAALKAITLK